MIEVVISTGIVSLLTLVVMAANVPLSKVSSEVGLALDMDRAAGRLLADLRREVRQSGYNLTGGTTNEAQVGIATGPNGKASRLTFRARRSFGNDLTVHWTPEITYALVASPIGAYLDGSTRYRLRCSRPDMPTRDVLDHVRDLELALIQGPDGELASLEVVLTLARDNPNWRGGTDARLIVREYRDVVEFLNKRQ